MTAPASGVKVRMYRQGLGDCFLLAFPTAGARPCYVLIDCGVLVGSPEAKQTMRRVAESVRDSTGGRIDVLVATHQHWDHLSGFEQARDIDGLAIVKLPHKVKKLERGFFTAASYPEFREKSQALLKQGVISEKDLKDARIERYIIGPIFNFDFFYSPIEDDTEKLELLGIDWRFETSLDGHVRLPAEQQRTLNDAQRIPEYVVVGHNAATLRESSLNDVFAIAERYVKATQQHFPPGIIGPFTLQTAVDKDLQFWVYDVSPRIGGGTNVHMSIGHPYGNSLWRRPMSTGRRIAMEIRRGIDTGRLGELVT